MKKSIMDRFQKLEGMKVEGSKIPPQPKAQLLRVGRLAQFAKKNHILLPGITACNIAHSIIIENIDPILPDQWAYYPNKCQDCLQTLK